MDTLAKYILDEDAKRELVKGLAQEFNIPVPRVERNNRLTSTLGRYYYFEGTIHLGRGIDWAETLVHEFAHHLTAHRHAGPFASAHGYHFNCSLRDAALKAIELLGVEMPGWKPVEPPHFTMEIGERVQVNPYRPNEQPWIGHVTGFTIHKVYVKREDDGHKFAGRTYRIAPNLLASAEIKPEDIKGLDIDLSDIIAAAGIAAEKNDT
jgi:hypothetical protein